MDDEFDGGFDFDGGDFDFDISDPEPIDTSFNIDDMDIETGAGDAVFDLDDGLGDMDSDMIPEGLDEDVFNTDDELIEMNDINSDDDLNVVETDELSEMDEPVTDDIPQDIPESDELSEMDNPEVIEEKTPQQEMAEYMSEHNYGREDFDEYVKDPRYQEINDRLLEQDGLDPVDYDAYRDPQQEMAEYMSEHNYGREDFDEYVKDPRYQEINDRLLERDGLDPVDYDSYRDPQQEMAEYMSEHNYGREDYAEYSQDPRYQEINDRLLERDGLDPVDYDQVTSEGMDDFYNAEADTLSEDTDENFGDVSSEIPEELPPEVQEEIPEESEEFPSEITEEVPPEVPEEIPEESEEFPSEITEEVPPEVPEEIPEESEEFPSEIPEEVPPEMPEEIPEESEEFPSEIPEEVPSEMPEEIPEEAEDLPSEIPEEIPPEMPDEISDEAEDSPSEETSDENWNSDFDEVEDDFEPENQEDIESANDMAEESSDQFEDDIDEPTYEADETGDTVDEIGDTVDENGDTENETGDIVDETGDTENETGDIVDETGDTVDETGDTVDEIGDTVDETGDTEDEIGDTVDEIGDVEDETGDTEDEIGDVEDETGDTEDETGDVEDGTGDTVDETGDVEDETGDTVDEIGDFEDETGDTEDETGDIEIDDEIPGEFSGYIEDSSFDLEAREEFPEMFEDGKYLEQGINEYGFEGTCGPTSQANAINELLGTNEFTENKVLTVAIDNDLCNADSLDPADNGGTSTDQFMELYDKMNEITGDKLNVERFDCENALSAEEMAEKIESGAVLNIAVDSDTLWDMNDHIPGEMGQDKYTDHWITVTGVDRNPDGTIAGFNLVDSGGGETYADLEKYERMCFGEEGREMIDPTCIAVSKKPEFTETPEINTTHEIPPEISSVNDISESDVLNADKNYEDMLNLSREYNLGVENFDDSQVKDVNPNLIRDVQWTDDEKFWDMHGNNKEFYMDMANNARELRQEMALNPELSKNPEALNAYIDSKGPEMRTAYDAFLNPDVKNPVKVYEYNGTYMLDGDGRHRIEAAKIVDMPIQVKVVGRYYDKSK